MVNKENKSSLPIVAAVLLVLYVLINIASMLHPNTKHTVLVYVIFAVYAAMSVVLFMRKKGVALIVPATAVFICDLIFCIDNVLLTINTMVEVNYTELNDPTSYIGFSIAIFFMLLTTLPGLIIAVISVLDLVHIRKKAVNIIANIVMVVSVSCDCFISLISLVPAIFAGSFNSIPIIAFNFVKLSILNAGFVLVCMWLTTAPVVIEKITEDDAVLETAEAV